MKKTVRTALAAVNLSAANQEQLEYRLAFNAARPNFAWVDENGGILTHMDFGLNQDVVWQLKAALDANGKVNLTVPQKPTYSRTEDVGGGGQYVTTLAFVTSTKYTLTVKKLGVNGAAPQTVIDIDFEKENDGDTALAGLAVNV